MERLRELREEQGLSQTRLAQRADLNPSTVNQIELGVRLPTMGTLHKLARTLGVSVSELVPDAPKALAR